MKKIFSNEPLETLDLSVRVHHSLRRAGINTIGDLLEFKAKGNISKIRNIGDKSLKEIDEKLEKHEIINVEGDELEFINLSIGVNKNKLNIQNMDGKQYKKSNTNDSLVQVLSNRVKSYDKLLSDILNWQTELINKQIEIDALHRNIKFQRKRLHEILTSDDISPLEKSKSLFIILGSLNILEELKYLTEDFSPRDFQIFIKYHGFTDNTLEQIAAPLDITRERVRQILEKLERNLHRKIKNSSREDSYFSGISAFIKIQTALCYAEDLGLEITYFDWSQHLIKSGLLGNQEIKGAEGIDKIELFLSICNLVSKKDIEAFKIPNNLRYAISLAADEKPKTPAKILKIRSTLPKEIKKEIKRHNRFSGAVDAKWLSQEINYSVEKTREILEALGFSNVKNDWYISKKFRKIENLTRFNVFEKTIIKMVQYCGPLKIEDISSGIRHAVSKTRYPAPPPEVVEQALKIRGYQEENGFWLLEAEFDEELNQGEKLIFSCFESIGPVLHHSEIAQAFIDSELSFPAIHATLNRSPLFEKVDHALYKLKGTSVTYLDIERAKNEGDRVPVNLEVVPHKTGVYKIYATLGLLPVGTGVFFSENLPKLSGEWECLVNNKNFGKLQVTDNEIRGLLEPFELLECEIGDRVCFHFNPWDRTISVEKVTNIENRRTY